MQQRNGPPFSHDREMFAFLTASDFRRLRVGGALLATPGCAAKEDLTGLTNSQQVQTIPRRTKARRLQECFQADLKRRKPGQGFLPSNEAFRPDGRKHGLPRKISLLEVDPGLFERTAKRIRDGRRKPRK